VTEDDLAGAAGYDDVADGYERYWAPVIRPAAERVLDLVASDLDGAAGAEVLDVGSGTGTLAIALLRRWPHHRVTGIDPAGGMLEIARRAADERLSESAARRFRAEVAAAERLPFDDGSFDVAMSSFVLQLVDDRAAALREIGRVLRPGGVAGWVAWRRAESSFEPDRIANELLDQAGFDSPEPDARNGDVESVEAVLREMRAAGFVGVDAFEGEVVHAWDARGYTDFLTQFDEASLFDDLEPDERAELTRSLFERMQALTAEQLTLRLPVVYAMGRAAR